MPRTDHEYIGDGVYASFDGYHVCLTTGHHENEPVVYLEDQVMDKLIAYYMKLKGKNDA